MNLQDLKRKYSGQTIPEWELKQLEQPPKPAPAKPKKHEPKPAPEPDPDSGE